MRNSRLITPLVLVVVLAYAIVRYVVVGTVPVSQLPVFIVDKALAVGAIVLVALALAIGPLVRMRAIDASWMKQRKALGVHGFVYGTLHALLAIATLSPARYGKLYDKAGVLTLEGGFVVLAGVLAFASLIVPAITSANVVRESITPAAWRRAQRLGVVALALGLAHVIVLGWRSWLAPATWPGSLPPLTAIAVTAVFVAFAIRGIAAHRAGVQSTAGGRDASTLDARRRGRTAWLWQHPAEVGRSHQ
jgi:DMSO/TMAO reductase YedYZ heme-binding membrane subunit